MCFCVFYRCPKGNSWASASWPVRYPVQKAQKLICLSTQLLPSLALFLWSSRVSDHYTGQCRHPAPHGLLQVTVYLLQKSFKGDCISYSWHIKMQHCRFLWLKHCLNVSSSLYFSLYRDLPDALPVFIGENEAKKGCTITQMGDNIFAAVLWVSSVNNMSINSNVYRWCHSHHFRFKFQVLFFLILTILLPSLVYFKWSLCVTNELIKKLNKKKIALQYFLKNFKCAVKHLFVFNIV